MINKIQGIAFLLIFIFVGTALLNESFVSAYNSQNTVRWSALFGIIGIGVSFVIITGGIDLSIGSTIGLTGCIFSILLVDWGWSIPLTLATVMLISLLIGLVHGLLITKMQLQPFVVTLCGLLIYRGVGRWITGDETQGFGSDYDDSLRKLATGKPVSFAMMMAITGLGTVVYGIWRWLDAGTAGQPRVSEDGNASSSEIDAGVAASTAVIAGKRYFAAALIGCGVLLAVIGSSRFWSGFEIEQGSSIMSLAGLDLKTWWAVVPSEGEARPKFLMQQTGLFLLPFSLLALIVILLAKDHDRSQWPIALTLTGGLLLVGLMKWGPSDGGALQILLTFVLLGVLLAGASWLVRVSMTCDNPFVPAVQIVVVTLSLVGLMGQTSFGKMILPAPFFVTLVFGILAAIFLNKTIYGRYLLALGNNYQAALYSGINTDRMTILAYLICSGAAGIFGILFALDNNSIQPAGHGNFYELYAIAAAVLGGCSLRGGEGSILGVVIGAAVVRVLFNSINLLGIPSRLEFGIIGAAILLGAFADVAFEKLGERKARQARLAASPDAGESV